jgi:hypothetical protein
MPLINGMHLGTLAIAIYPIAILKKGFNLSLLMLFKPMKTKWLHCLLALFFCFSNKWMCKMLPVPLKDSMYMVHLKSCAPMYYIFESLKWSFGLRLRRLLCNFTYKLLKIYTKDCLQFMYCLFFYVVKIVWHYVMHEFLSKVVVALWNKFMICHLKVEIWKGDFKFIL